MLPRFTWAASKIGARACERAGQGYSLPRVLDFEASTAQHRSLMRGVVLARRDDHAYSTASTLVRLAALGTKAMTPDPLMRFESNGVGMLGLLHMN